MSKMLLILRGCSSANENAFQFFNHYFIFKKQYVHMARRNVDLTSLSFLDVLTSALGSVIFLFIVVPKLPDSPNPTCLKHN
ncbi:MAG: hypothetical protein HC817_00575 [Saprospiraceae bacterium]|nr:hypothetical protein [Saprospiraceae bacterium]